MQDNLKEYILMNLLSTFQKAALVSLPILSIISVPNLAHGNSYQFAQSTNCNNPQTTLEMRICASESYGKADQKLNEVYRQLKPRLGTSRQKKLIAAQRAWIKFRDESCAFEGSEAEGGTLEPVLQLSCLADVTEQRVQDLERYLEVVNNR